MKVIFHTNIVSPHQIPWCREMLKLTGEKDFLYVAEEALHQERAAMGWSSQTEAWIHISEGNGGEQERELLEQLETCDILICSLRRFDLFQRRMEKGLKTYYMFERWFKPPAGAWRMLYPGYFQMCRQACRLFQNSCMRLLPIGLPAVMDWLRMEDLCRGKFCGSQNMIQGKRHAMDEIRKNMFLWGYFVQETAVPEFSRSQEILQVLWCGRMLDWKRVDTIVKAVVFLLNQGVQLHLHLIGDGPEKERLLKLAGPWQRNDRTAPGISFGSSVPMDVVRQTMREHDVYVLSSDGGEGWGAAANEAMNEGMILVGTYEAGSTATMLEDGKNGFLYPAKDDEKLAGILTRIIKLKKNGGDLPLRHAAEETMTANWSPVLAAKKMFESFSI